MKKFFTFFSALCGLLVLFGLSNGYAQVNLESGLVAKYYFNGNANDESGNGNDGTVNGATLTQDRFGNVGKAYSFDGVSNCIDINSTFFNNGWQDYTISGWFCSDNLSKTLQSFFNTIPHNGVSLVLNQTGSNKVYYYVNSNPSTPWSWDVLNDSSITDNFQNNQWYHFTFQKNGDLYKSYINGNIENTIVGNLTPISYDCGLKFGDISTWSGSNQTFSGKLDDYRIYDRILNEQEIEALYQEGGWSSLNQGLVAHYPFNGNANDESGNGNNGTVNGATLTTDRFGNVNSAYSFDGVDDYIRCINGGPTGNPTVTATFWIKTNTTTSGHIIGYGNDGIGGNDFRIIINAHCGPNSIAFDTYYDNIGFTTNHSNTWDFYTVVYDGLIGNNTSVAKIYKNGVLLENVCFTFSGYSTNISPVIPITFGRYHGTVETGYFNGLIDDIRIYNRALTEAEIQALYLEGQGIQATITIPDTIQNITQTLEIPVNTSTLNTSDNIISYQFNLAYDNTKLQYSNYSLTGTIASGGTATVNNSTPGQLQISYMTSTPLSGAGAILKLLFNPLQAGVSDLLITDFLYNTDTINNIENGTVTITNCVADTVEVNATICQGQSYTLPDNAVVSQAGTYYVTLQNSAGCDSVIATHILQNTGSIPIVTFTAPPVCASIPPGVINYASITFNGTAEPNATYEWTVQNAMPQTTFTTQNVSNVYWADVVSATYYDITLTVTNPSGCTATTTQQIQVVQAASPSCCEPPPVNAGADASVCAFSYLLQGSVTGAIASWEMVSGPGTAIFANTNNASTMVTVSLPGIYTFQLSAVAGTCNSSDIINISFLSEPSANAGSDDQVCGLVYTLQANSPGTGTSGNWSCADAGVIFANPQSNSSSVTVSSAGVYSFVWTVSNGTCSEADTVQVHFINVPVPNAGTNQTVCGNTVNLTGTPNGSVFNGHWIGPNGTLYQPNDTSNVVTAIILPVTTQIDVSFWWHQYEGVCHDSDEVVISFQPFAGPGQVVAGFDLELCDTVAILNGTNYIAGTTTTWTTSSSNISISDPLSEDPMISLNPALTDFGDSSKYTTAMLFTVSNGSGCTASDIVNVTFYQRPIANAGTDQNTCGLSTDMNAQPSLTAFAGQWSLFSGPSSNPVFSDMTNPSTSVQISSYGTYYFIWRERNMYYNACSSTDTVAIDFNPVYSATNNPVICNGQSYFAGGAYQTTTGTYYDNYVNVFGCDSIITTNLTVTNLTLNINIQAATCGQENGSATAVVSGGATPYAYTWTSGHTTAFADSLSAGIYLLTVSDANACVITGMASISNTGGPEITGHSITNVNCYGAATGAIQITVSGASLQTTYLWSNGATTQNISGLTAGAYEVEVSDDAGCMATASYFVSQAPAFNATANSTSATCGTANGSATITANGGTPPYAYNWSNGLQTNFVDTLSAGVYMITVTDANACSSSPVMVSINSTGGPVITSDSVLQTGCAGNDGAVYVSVSGGTQPYMYNWSNNETSEDITGLSTGNYQLTVTDASGCIGAFNATIEYMEINTPQICIVTVDSSEGKNLIVWEKEITSDIDHYNIYREGSWAGYYALAGTKLYSEVSQFVDMNSNPAMRAYRYKITAVDHCGNESEASTPHKTLHLAINDGIGSSWNLIWTEYEGFNFPGYYIYRYMSSTGWQLIDSIATGYNSYTDLPPNQGQLNYMITVNSPYVCNPTGNKEMGGPFSQSLSNIEDNGIIDPVSSQLLKATDVEFTVYPNPAKNELIIESDLQHVSKFEITNIFGQKILCSEFNKKATVDISALPGAVYLIKIISNEKSYLRKFIKE